MPDDRMPGIGEELSKMKRRSLFGYLAALPFLPLASKVTEAKAIEFGPWHPEQLPSSVNESMRYAMNKAYFLADDGEFYVFYGVSPPRPATG